MTDFKNLSGTMIKFYNEALADIDPILFTSIIGSFVDMYEYDHKDTFDGKECLETILEIRDDVKEQVKDFEDGLDGLTAIELLKSIFAAG